MKSAATWFYILSLACVAGPYLLRVRPTTQQDWTYVAVTIAFLAWMLLLMEPVRASA